MLALVHRLCDQLPDVIAEKYLKKLLFFNTKTVFFSHFDRFHLEFL